MKRISNIDTKIRRDRINTSISLPEKKEPIRILQILGTLNRGGAETRLMQIYRAIDPSLVQFDFAISTSEKQYYSDEVFSLGGDIYFIDSIKNVGIKAYIKRWHNVFMAGSYQIVHAHTNYKCGIALFFAWCNGIRIRIAHSRNSMNSSDGSIKFCYWHFMRILTNITSNVKIMCSYEAGVNLFGEKKVKKDGVVFLPNAINLREFQPSSAIEKHSKKEELDLLGFQYVIGTIGNARPVKNHPFLIRAFNAALKLESNMKLLLVGNCEDDGDAMKLVGELGIEDKVVFTGARNDIPDLLSVMDLFILPSFSEGAPGSAIEAQAANLPVILSDSITRDVDVGTGLVKYISLNSPLELWAKEMLDSCKMKRPDITQTHRILSEHSYDVSTCVEKLMEIYGINASAK